MKILLISPSYAYGKNTQYFPLGLSYISSYIKQFGHEVIPLNMNHYGFEERYNELEKILNDKSIDLIGITGLTIAFNEIDKITQFIRKISVADIVLGGGITSCESKMVMEVIKPNYMVISEGELIFRNLLDALETKQSLFNVKGIWYWHKDEPIYTGEGDSVRDLNVLPSPDIDLFGMEEHLEIQSNKSVAYHETRIYASKTIPITASRSCPFKCTFCYHAGMGKYKRHDIKLVVDEIESYVKKYNASHFSIYDELFSANKARIYEFCQLIKERKLNISWFCQLRVDQLDQDMLYQMKEAGCIHISYGFESGSNMVLDSMKKKITSAQISHAVKLTRKAKIAIQANFLFGDPAETLETLEESLRFQSENELYFNDWSAVIPYPGTTIYQFALDNNLITDREEFVKSMCNISGYLWKSMINMTRMPDKEYKDWYVKLREINDMNHRKRLIKVKQSKVIDSLHSDLDLECPSCGDVTQYHYFPYPLDVDDDGNYNSKSPLGMMGINFLCNTCNRKAHLKPNQIPHIKEMFDKFIVKIKHLKMTQQEIVLLPALDRFESVFFDDINMDGLNIISVLDSRDFRINSIFKNKKILKLAEENVSNKKAMYIIMPWVEYQEATDILINLNINKENILSWNQTFVDFVDSKNDYLLDYHCASAG